MAAAQIVTYERAKVWRLAEIGMTVVGQRVEIGARGTRRPLARLMGKDARTGQCRWGDFEEAAHVQAFSRSTVVSSRSMPRPGLSVRNMVPSFGITCSP